MKFQLYLLLVVSFFSVYSDEIVTETIAFNNTAPISLNPAFEEAQEEERSSPAYIKKNGLYVTLTPTPPFADGVSFRHRFNPYSFLEISYLHTKQAEIYIYRTIGFFKREILKTLGATYNNSLNTNFALRWNTRFLDPYFSLGAGLYFPYTNYPSGSIDFIPSIGTTIGLECSYGFLDLAVNYLLFKWEKVVKIQDKEYDVNGSCKQKIRTTGALRIGFGLPF